MNMDFNSAEKLLELCEQNQLPISEVMRQRECILGEMPRDAADHRMNKAWEIMRTSATQPLKKPIKSMGGLIGGEAKKLEAHYGRKKSICGDVLGKAMIYAMAVLEVNASMGLIVAAPTAGSAGVVPGMMLALQECYRISDQRIIDALYNAGAVGYLAMRNATVAGAVGGCQAEIGVASAMAASAAVEALGGFYEENKKSLKKEPVVFLTGACANMNEAVCRYSRENRISSMGTTMALLSFSEKAIYACNLGDSRIYRHFQGKLQQISTDHVISGKMLGKAPLTQYLGFQEENMALEPSIVEIGYQTGSSYLICSDGVTDMLSDEEIQEILSKTGTAEEKVEELLEMALSRGGRDNVTMILAQINGYEEKNPLKRWAERHSTGR